MNTATPSQRCGETVASGTPMIDDYYRAELPTGSNDLKATVDAYGAALDQVFAQFYADLRKHGQKHAG